MTSDNPEGASAPSPDKCIILMSSIEMRSIRVRVKDVATVERNGRQAAFWADMRTAPREHMEIAFQQRRQQIVGDCRQLKLDVDSYNENHNAGEELQMVLDFPLDLEEIEALAAIA